MEDKTNPEDADTSDFEEIFADDSTDETVVENQEAPKKQEEGTEDVLGKGEVEELSLDELNKASGREFKSKEAYLKHYKNLNKLVGDQDLAKKRKETKSEEIDPTAKELAELKKDLAKKDFLLETPTAKEFLDVVEAYAEMNDMSLSEAWEAKFTGIAESSQSKNIINKNRTNPVQSQKISELAKLARSGDQDAQDELIEATVWKK